MRVVPSVHSDDYYGEKEDNSGDGDRQTTRATPTIKPSTETDQPHLRSGISSDNPHSVNSAP
jgi:hypothetical protein